MSIESQIEAAWKDGEPWIADDDYPMVPKEQLLRLIKEMFKDGYLAALRSLFVEVNPEDLQEGGIYHAQWADHPMREVYYNGEQLCYWETGGIGPNGEIEHLCLELSPGDCEIREFVFPFPSDIFGRRE